MPATVMPSLLAMADRDGTGMVRVRSVRGAMGSRGATGETGVGVSEAPTDSASYSGACVRPRGCVGPGGVQSRPWRH
jgi:hypothetical protein